MTTVTERDIDPTTCRASAYAHLVRLDTHLAALRDSALRERPGTPRAVLRTLRRCADDILCSKVKEARMRLVPPHLRPPPAASAPQPKRTRPAAPRTPLPTGPSSSHPHQPGPHQKPAALGLRPWMPTGRYRPQKAEAAGGRAEPVVDDSPRAAAVRARPLSPHFHTAASDSPNSAQAPPQQPQSLSPRRADAADPGSTAHSGRFDRAMLEFPPLCVSPRERRRLVDSAPAPAPEPLQGQPLQGQPLQGQPLQGQGSGSASPRTKGESGASSAVSVEDSPPAAEARQPAQPRGRGRGKLRPLCCGRFAPTGDRVASAGRDRAVRIWDVRTGLKQPALVGHRGWVLGLAWAPGGDRLASCGDDNTVVIWDTRTDAAHLRTLTGHGYAVWAVAWSSRGGQLASCGADSTVRVWCAESYSTLQVLRGHRGAVYSCCFGGRWDELLCTAGRDGSVVAWEWRERKVVAKLPHGAIVWSAAFNRQADLIASACADGTARVWRVSDQVCLRCIPGHAGGVRRALISDSGEYLIACAATGIYVWPLAEDVELLAPVTRLQPPCGAQARDVDCRGSFLLAAGLDGVMRIWTCPALGDAPASWWQEPATSEMVRKRRIEWTGAAMWGRESAEILPERMQAPFAQQLSAVAYTRCAALPTILRELRSRALTVRPPTQVALLKYLCKVTDELLLRAQGDSGKHSESRRNTQQLSDSGAATNVRESTDDAASVVGAIPLSTRGHTSDPTYVVMGDFWEAFAETTCRDYEATDDVE